MKIQSFYKSALWLLVIALLSFMPSEWLPKVEVGKIPEFDKLVHVVMYFILALLLVKPLRSLKLPAYISAFMVTLLLGGVFELMQLFVFTTHTASWKDQLANLTGVLLGLAFHRLLVSGRQWERYF